MVQYYTLEQAATLLRTTAEQLKEMARKGEVRAFQDRGTLRFRSQEIDELARTRGLGSEPELQIRDAPQPKTSVGKKTAPRKTSHAPDADEVNLGMDPSASKGSRPSSPRPGAPRSSAAKSPPPKSTGDSDVRLVSDSSDLDFAIDIDSDVKVEKDPGSKSPKPGKSKSPADQGDSGVRIVPLDQPSDSDVKITPSDSKQSGTKRPADSDPRRAKERDDRDVVTEEIDLDAEAQRAPQAPKSKLGKPTKARPKVNPPAAPPVLPTSSPFELSENDLDEPQPARKGPDSKKGPDSSKGPASKGVEDSSSDFELTPYPADDSSPLELGSDELSPLPDDEEVSLGELTGGKRESSGINLRDPADSGISLEQGGSDEIEFDLSLDAGGTPKPSPSRPEAPDSSEFELSLSGDDARETADESSSSEFELSLSDDDSKSTADESSSEFELSLDADSSGEAEPEQARADSDSEFELTLDESGGLAPMEEGEAGEEEKDIFETDFEVPALDEESGSEAVALDEADTDMESSDFDLDLDQEAPAEEGEESGSQVVALDEEEEADAAAATVARPRPKVKRKPAKAAEEEEGAEEGEEPQEDIEEDLEPEPEEEEGAETATVGAAAAPPAPWGPLPALALMFCLAVLVPVGLMSFEMVQGQWGYHKSSKVSRFVIDPIARSLWDENLPKD